MPPRCLRLTRWLRPPNVCDCRIDDRRRYLCPAWPRPDAINQMCLFGAGDSLGGQGSGVNMRRRIGTFGDHVSPCSWPKAIFAFPRHGVPLFELEFSVYFILPQLVECLFLRGLPSPKAWHSDSRRSALLRGAADSSFRGSLSGAQLIVRSEKEESSEKAGISISKCSPAAVTMP